MLFLATTTLCGSAVHAADSKKPKLEIAPSCLNDFQLGSVLQIGASVCKPNPKERISYDSSAGNFYWVHPKYGKKDGFQRITFSKLGNFKNISVYSVANDQAIIRQIIFLQNDGKIIKKVLTLGGGRPCEASYSEDLKWQNGFVDAEFDYGIYLAFERLLPKESKDSLNNSAFQGYPYADYCMLTEKRRVDLHTFKTETISYQFADTVLSVTPEPDEDIGCVNKELAKLKAQKLTHIDLPPEKAKEIIRQIYEACKNTP